MPKPSAQLRLRRRGQSGTAQQLLLPLRRTQDRGHQPLRAGLRRLLPNRLGRRLAQPQPYSLAHFLMALLLPLLALGRNRTEERAER